MRRKKSMVTDKDASIGKPTYINGKPEEAATVKTNGIKITNPTE